MDYVEFLEAQRPEGLTPVQRQQAISAAREAQQDAREARQAEARQIEAAERHERLALAARQLGIDAGAVTRSAAKLGEAQAAVDELEGQLARAVAKRDSARRSFDHISRSLSQAAEAAGPRGDVGLGDLTVERQRDIHAALSGAGARRTGWLGG